MSILEQLKNTDEVVMTDVDGEINISLKGIHADLIRNTLKKSGFIHVAYILHAGCIYANNLGKEDIKEFILHRKSTKIFEYPETFFVIDLNDEAKDILKESEELYVGDKRGFHVVDADDLEKLVNRIKKLPSDQRAALFVNMLQNKFINIKRPEVKPLNEEEFQELCKEMKEFADNPNDPKFQIDLEDENSINNALSTTAKFEGLTKEQALKMNNLLKDFPDTFILKSICQEIAGILPKTNESNDE